MSRLKFPLRLRDQIDRNIAAMRVQGIEPPPHLLKLAEELKGPEPKRRQPSAPRLDAPHKPLERDILKAIVQALRLHPRVLKVVRFNSGGSMHRGADGREQLVLFSSEPVPDLHIILRDGWCWIEVKRPPWTRPRDEREERQARFLERVREAGGIGAFCCSVDEAIAAIDT